MNEDEREVPQDLWASAMLRPMWPLFVFAGNGIYCQERDGEPWVRVEDDEPDTAETWRDRPPLL